AIAKRERPSVLEGLKRPLPPRSMEKKPRQQEQEAR
ncbi:helicase, partial [bacterium 1XD42-8]